MKQAVVFKNRVCADDRDSFCAEKALWRIESGRSHPPQRLFRAEGDRVPKVGVMGRFEKEAAIA